MPPHREMPLRHLATQIEFMLFAHQVIVDLLETPGLAGIIEGLKDPAARATARADPLKFARDAGVILPAEGVSIQITEFPHSFQIDVQIAHEHALVIFGLNSRKGFFVI